MAHQRKAIEVLCCRINSLSYYLTATIPQLIHRVINAKRFAEVYGLGGSSTVFKD